MIRTAKHIEGEYMNFVVGDIHNDGRRFKELIREIKPGENDTVFLLGDLFLRR